MSIRNDDNSPQRVLVMLPNWVGDVVLATPLFAALRAHLGAARITFLMRRYVGEIVDGGGWCDDVLYWPAKRGIVAARTLVRQIRGERFDLAILFTNSFRSALVAALAGIPRRVGYAREARGWLLTDRLRPLRQRGEFVPRPMLEYYTRLVECVGARVTDSKLRLAITSAQEQAGAVLAAHYGLGVRRYVVVNPGAAFGASKCWLPEGFARACDLAAAELELLPVLIGAPGELPLLREIARLAQTRVVVCENPGTTLGSLKPLVRDAALLICNDTGPRHYGNAFDIPTVTIFGPTFQEWTDTGYDGEVKLQAEVPCGPCQLPVCPLDHRCMKLISAEMVIAAGRRLLERRAACAAI